MGVTVTVNRANGKFGRAGHNGVSLVGTPTATIFAAIVIAKISEAALKSCKKSDKDSCCGMFCREVRPADISNNSARAAGLRRSKEWLQSGFSAQCAPADWNTPKKFRRDTPTAALGKQSGEKRKVDFEHESALVTKHHMRAIGYFGV